MVYIADISPFYIDFSKRHMISIQLMAKLYKSAQMTLCQVLCHCSRDRDRIGSMLLMMVSLLLQKRPGKKKREQEPTLGVVNPNVAELQFPAGLTFEHAGWSC